MKINRLAQITITLLATWTVGCGRGGDSGLLQAPSNASSSRSAKSVDCRIPSVVGDASHLVLAGAVEEISANPTIRRLPPIDGKKRDDVVRIDLGTIRPPSLATPPPPSLATPDPQPTPAAPTDESPVSRMATIPEIEPVPMSLPPESQERDGVVANPLSGEIDFGVPMEATSPSDLTPVAEQQLSQLRLPAPIAERGRRLLQQANSMANRGALYAARREFVRIMRTITQSLDSQLGQQYHTRALIAGVRALEEADDFALATRNNIEDDVHLESFVKGHKTPVLKGKDLDRMTPLIAIQQYYEFAKEQLTIAGGRFPLSSEVLYSIGRAESFIGQQQGKESGAPKSLAFFYAALATNPANARASNELGVMLAQRGRLVEAASVIHHGVQMGGSPTTVNNLAKIYEQLGDPRAAEMRTHAQRLAASPQGTAYQSVSWVTPAQFARMGNGLQGARPTTTPASSVVPATHTSPNQAPHNPSTGGLLSPRPKTTPPTNGPAVSRPAPPTSQHWW